jgi:hypothetical protein
LRNLSYGNCTDYINKPINQLDEPPLSGSGDNCWNVYTARKYAEEVDIYPYSIEAYDRGEARRNRNKFFLFAAVVIPEVLIASGLIYFVGFLIAWVRRGFVQAT